MEILRIVGEVALLVLSIVLAVFKKKSDKNIGSCNDSSSLFTAIFKAVITTEEKYKSLESKGVDCSRMKLDDVMLLVKTTALANGWEFKDIDILATVETLIKFSKEVNYKKNDKEDT